MNLQRRQLTLSPLSLSILASLYGYAASRYFQWGRTATLAMTIAPPIIAGLVVSARHVQWRQWSARVFTRTTAPSAPLKEPQESALSNFNKLLDDPITLDKIERPVVVPCCGKTFDKTSLSTWLNGKNSCPLCNANLCESQLIPNLSVKKILMDALGSQSKGVTEFLECEIKHLFIAPCGHSVDRSSIDATWWECLDHLPIRQYKEDELVPNLLLRELVASINPST